MKNKFFKSVAAFCLMISASTLTVSANAAEIKGAAGDFTLKSSLGKNLRLQEYRGQVVLINFWASWCGPCRQEMPILEDIYKKYEKFGFTIFAVNVDEDSSLANEFLKDTKVSFPILYDNQNKVSRMYDVKAMPTTVIVDRNGNMRYLHKGYQPGTEDHYVKEVKALIRE